MNDSSQLRNERHIVDMVHSWNEQTKHYPHAKNEDVAIDTSSHVETSAVKSLECFVSISSHMFTLISCCLFFPHELHSVHVNRRVTHVVM